MPEVNRSLKKSQFKKPTKKSSTDSDEGLDLDLGAVVTPPLLIHAETATVAFVRAEHRKSWGQEKTFLWFAIIDPVEHMGSELFMSCVRSKGGKFAPGSKMTAAWTLANGKPPDRYDRRSLRVFKGKNFVAKLHTVTKNKNGIKPAHTHYTIIEDLLSLG